MCFSAIHSRNSFILNLISSLTLFHLTNLPMFKVISLFLLFVGQMQLFDYLFWTFPPNSFINFLSTKSAIIFNHLQPIIYYFLLYFYNYHFNFLDFLLLFLYISFIIPYTYFSLQNIDYTSTINIKGKQVMNWKWNKLPFNKLIYFIFLMCLIVASSKFENLIISIIAIFSTIISFFISTKTPILNYSPGRLWCYYASLGPSSIIILYIFYKKYLKSSYTF